MNQVCTKCKKEKDESSFGKDKRRRSGLKSWCKDCHNESSRALHRKKVEAGFIRERKPVSQEASARYARAHYLKHKEKHHARSRAWQQTQKGRLCTYKQSASHRKIPWKLTDEEFFHFWKEDCSFCNDPIDTIGLDRIDSSKGYEKGNIRSCCFTCNKAKGTLSQEEFLGMVKKIHNKLHKHGERNDT
jgi:hypothetical protein